MDSAFEYFRNVARLGSIRKAAGALNVSASSISRQIQKLEHFYGAVLIQRHSQGVKLTPEGQIVARFLESQAREMERLNLAIDALKGLQRGHVTICTVEGMIGGVLPRVLARFSRQYPGITYDVRVAGTDNVMRDVAEDRCDIGISFHPKPHENIEVVAVLEQPLLALVSPAHPLAAQGCLRLQELAGKPVALPDSSFGIRHLIDQVVIRDQVDLTVRLESNSIEMLRQFALHEMGVVFLPAFACEREIESGELIAVPTTDGVLSSAKVHICRNDRFRPTQAAQAFIKELAGIRKPIAVVANNATTRTE